MKRIFVTVPAILAVCLSCTELPLDEALSHGRTDVPSASPDGSGKPDGTDTGQEEGESGDETEEEKSFRLEREALIAVWHSLGGENWPEGGGMSRSPEDGKTYINSTKYWCTDEPVWVWAGVTVNGQGHVTELVLGHELGVTGIIPEEIGNLKYLNHLYIHTGPEGNVYGTLPESIGGLSKMARLYLLGCHLEGDLETSPLRELVKNANRLMVLDIGGNNFTGGCPAWLGTMQSDAVIHIEDNRLTGQVPQKLKDHPIWNSPAIVNGEWGCWWQGAIVQQEGYGLWI